MLLYLTISIVEYEARVEDIINTLRESTSISIIMGDLNAKSPL